MTPTVISLFDLTGNMVRPWIEGGYHAITVDLQAAPPEPGRTHIVVDVGALTPAFVAQFAPQFMFAFPPCTDLAVSGARWFPSKGLGALVDALRLVNAARELCEASGAPWLLENPVGTISSYWRKWDYIFDPCDFGGYLDPIGDEYTKRTCLWTGGGFVMPPKRPVEPRLGSKMHRVPPGENRANERSETPMGFARAVYEANRGGVEW